MIAVDTNVVVRLLTGDEPAQLVRAKKLFEQEVVFLPKTVLVETEWVLRSLYGLASREVNRGLAALVDLPRVHVEDTVAVAQALQWHRSGLDFADAVHLASSHAVQRFATFDRRLMRRAATLAMHAVVEEP